MDENLDLFEKQQIKSKLVEENEDLQQEITGLAERLLTAFWQKYPPLHIVDHLQFTQQEITEWIAKYATQERP